MSNKLIEHVARRTAFEEAIKAVEGVGKVYFTGPDGKEEWRVPSRNDLTNAIRALPDAPTLPKMPKLLPCPFCGGAPKLIEVREMPDNFVREHNIRCDDCAVDLYAEYESEVVENWNHRPPAGSVWGPRKAEKDAELLFMDLADGLIEKLSFTEREEILGLLVKAMQGSEQTNFQARVELAHTALFDDDPTDVPERVARFFEEANEAAQALGMTREDAHALVDYTYSRPIGEPAAEIGAVAVTLASLCVVAGFDLSRSAEDELARLQLPETIERIKAKRSTRHGRGPLPGFSPTEGGDA